MSDLAPAQRKVPPRAVLACFFDPGARRRAEAALEDRAPLWIAHSRADFESVLARRADSVGSVIVGIGEHDAEGLSIVGRVAARYSHIAIVVHADRSNRSGIRAATIAGAHAFVFRGASDDGMALREQLNSASMEASRRATFNLLEPGLPARLHRCVRRCLVDLDETTTITSIAERLEVTRQTLFNQCAASAVCGPEELRTWCRMIFVAHVLCWTSWTPEQVAYSLGFPSVTALRNAIKRHVGETASELRVGLGPARVLTAFLRRLTEVAEETSAAVRVKDS